MSDFSRKKTHRDHHKYFMMPRPYPETNKNQHQNQEVRITYAVIVENYFASKIENEKLEIMLKALVEGDIVLFEEMLQTVVTAVFSYHDLSGEPEKVYHALVAGMLTWIANTHEIKSNRESGYGRYGIMNWRANH